MKAATLKKIACGIATPLQALFVIGFGKPTSYKDKYLEIHM